jgi:hypothetical protein
LITLSATRRSPSSRLWTPGVALTAFVTGASTVIMGTLPLLIGYFADELPLDWQEIGWLGAAGQGGTLTGTLLAYWLIERGVLRMGQQLGAAAAFVFSLLAATTDSFAMLLSWMALTSTGVGCVFAIGTYILGRSPHPARNFSIMSGVQVACGALHAAALPWIDSHFGHVVALSSIAFWFAFILILVSGSSSAIASENGGVTESTPPSAGQVTHGLSAASLLVAVLAFQTAGVVIWMYSERIGTAAGILREHIAVSIALGNLGGIPASLLGTLAGERFGYLRILFLATVTLICGELLIFGASSGTAYAGGQLCFNFGWMLGVSYYLGMLAKNDPSGRMIRLAPIVLVIAGAVGPLFVAFSTTHGSSIAILSLSLFCSTGALALAVARRG